MHDGKSSGRLLPVRAGNVARAAGEDDGPWVEDVLGADLLDDELVDREYLREVFREPARYLPPPRTTAPGKLRPRRPSREPESRLARRAKLLGLILAAALLFGAVVAASLLAQQRELARGDADAAAGLQITGAAALGGFVMPTDLPSTPATTHPTPTSTAASPEPRRGEGSAERPTGEPGTAPAAATGSPVTSAPLAPAADRLGTVREFYRLIDVAPEHALGLLDPVLVGDRTGDLVRAWSAMTAVTLESVREQADGSILAVVTMLQPDGRRLRVTHVLDLADGPAGVISQVRLVSARHI
ncbi:hypothetical protein SAMN05421810_105327 [Amycolatopsis arida]|uniref:Uncharacterized protein n=1 Tax=Amycolatopsis arida TaxID=587909 RepID=A0A1I5WXP8_9PSEU|nr:hypothetical protein [Amycolatopsis arida]TDX92501.1 hypothetical protein CLV69_105346 [Amycolatopsis arida]SFQ24418.1 hypothetical protein SAMN05421810_105327 [Amycolatopsis arida]